MYLYTFNVSQYAESLQPQVEAWSKRHSTSDLRTETFSDVCKQGWLHYKQVHTEKRKVHIWNTQSENVSPQNHADQLADPLHHKTP